MVIRIVILLLTVNIFAQYTKLEPNNLGSSRSWFGACICLRDSILIIGAPWDNGGVKESGSAFIYRKGDSGWFQEQKLVPQDIVQANRFGNSAIIGCQDDSGGKGFYIGSAYLFTYVDQKWIETKKFTPPDTTNYQFFGSSVSIYKNYILIGACNSSIDDAIYLYKYDDNDWIVTDIIRENGLGYCLSIYDLFAIVGDGEEANIFKISNDSLIEVQDVPYGHSVCISDHYAIGSSSYVNDGLGAAAVYRREDTYWTFDSYLSTSNSDIIDRFGYSSAIHEEIALVGSYTDDQYGENSGSAYIFSKNKSNWTEKKITPDDIQEDYLFGHGLSISDAEIIIGAPWNNSAYIYKIKNLTNINTLNKSNIKHFMLEPNFPNPFNPETTIKYNLPADQSVYPVKIKIYNPLGQLITTLKDEPQNPGLHTVKWNGKNSDGQNMSSGIYFCVVEAGKIKATQEMLLVR